MKRIAYRVLAIAMTMDTWMTDSIAVAVALFLKLKLKSKAVDAKS